ncbi:MAG: UDP-N-acetylmuramoyl-L-alanyl-D-glutamate--2,6-diaminopimelate ligase [Bowdeniella nasicola]|nr:UDP-N-acetylmuramoyl-L-alanyl-D-glutamate--2,6-diaminopimelate ligase [Bowdeniella nasicola]
MDELIFTRPTVAPTPMADLAYAIGAEVRGGGHASITGVSVDSSDIRPGEVFIAIPGFRTHGARFANVAVEAGAAAIITDDAGAEQIGQVTVPVLVVADPRAVVGQVSALLYRQPCRDLELYAVTGTNGKTSTVTILSQILAAAKGQCGLFGTVEVRLGEDRSLSPRTTLEASVVNRLLALGRERGIRAVAMEASSHAIDLGRLGGLHCRAVGFVNLQHDHLDYHKTMDGYFAAKAALFTREYADHAVVCIDDEWGQKLARTTELPVLTVSTTGPADLQAIDYHEGTFTVVDGEEHHRISTPFTGRFMMQNALVSIGLARISGVDWPTLTAALATAHSVPGRMQVVQPRTDTLPLVIVDYAHTAQALAYVLEVLRPSTPGRLIAVYGSDGDRDALKRPDLGRVGATYADVLYITDENPRSEDPAAIRAAILEGVAEVRPDLADTVECETRRQAIIDAIGAAEPADTVIITGKGAEPFQEIKGVMHPYNDVPVVEQACKGETA